MIGIAQRTRCSAARLTDDQRGKVGQRAAPQSIEENRSTAASRGTQKSKTVPCDSAAVFLFEGLSSAGE